MGLKGKRGELEVLSIIFRRYVLRIPQIRVLIVPVVLSIFAGKYFETKTSDCISQISSSLGSEDSPRDKILVYFVVSLLSTLLTELQGFAFVSAVQSVYRHTLRSTFEHFIRMEAEEFDVHGSGKIQSIISRKSKAISEFIEVVVQNLLPVVLGFVLVSLSIYSKMGVFVTAVVVGAILLYGFLTISVALWRNKIRRALNRAENLSSNTAYDSLSNHEAVVSFNNYEMEVRRYDEGLIDIERCGVSLFRGLYVLNMIQKLIFAVLNSLVVFLGVYGVLTRRVDKDLLIFYFTASRILLSNLNNLGYTYCRFMEAMVNAKEALSEDYSVCGDTGVAVARFRQSVVFNDVGLCYGDKRVMSGVNLVINRGDRVAVVGPNGSGKSTMLKALLRFNRYHGSIWMDGIDIQAVENSSFRSIVSYVPQSPTLFNETVMYNVKYGSPGSSDYSVVELAKRFNIHNSIMRLENGYSTRVGEYGKHISGGERQKIAVLRALMQKPDILVMDEPTSNLDGEAEHEILGNIMSGAGSLTVVAIVHNLNLLGFFNKICLVDEGRVRVITDLEAGELESIVARLRSHEDKAGE